jgi:hypothetical protein
LPALATLALGVSFLLPRRARTQLPAVRAERGARTWLRAPRTKPQSGRETAGAEGFAAAVAAASPTDEPEPQTAIDPARCEAEACGAPSESICVRTPRVRAERSVPLTRLPLRTAARGVDWPSRIGSEPVAHGIASRRRLLAELAAAGAPETVFIAAYREEDAAGRVLALRGLQQCRSDDARSICEEALRDGTDDERALALEALAAAGARDSLAAALADPVDAIAARAALAFVGTRERADYRLALGPYVDPARIDVLLTLLAGYLR